jgi:hypothetical protein
MTAMSTVAGVTPVVHRRPQMPGHFFGFHRGNTCGSPLGHRGITCSSIPRNGSIGHGRARSCGTLGTEARVGGPHLTSRFGRLSTIHRPYYHHLILISTLSGESESHP